MGAGASSSMGPGGHGGAQETGLGDLPESCIAELMLHLDPPGICKLAMLSRTFRGAASGDFVWVTKLPTNYQYLLDKASDEMEHKVPLTKKEIYAQLCRRNPFDGGTKEFWLEKRRGRLCMSISSQALLITGIDDRRYWNTIPTEESRFHSVAYLQQIWWVEVDGEIEFCFPPGTYSLYFRLHLGRPVRRLGRRMCNTELIHGWDVKPVRFQLWTSDGQHALCQCKLDEDRGCWVRYHVGDFIAAGIADVPTKLKFSMKQIDCTHTKGGLCVDSVLICPKGLIQEKISPLHLCVNTNMRKKRSRCTFLWHRTNLNYVPTQMAMVPDLPSETKTFNDWYLDSGASAHLTSNMSNLEHPNPYIGGYNVIVVNGKAMPIAHHGKVILQTSN